MHIPDFLGPTAIAVKINVDSKGQAIRLAAKKIAEQAGLDAGQIAKALLAREDLGSTGVGGGIALPHVCMAGVDRAYTWFCTLAEPIDFQAIDDEPVDLICTIVNPPAAAGASMSLSQLAAISRILRDENTAAALRKATNAWEAYDILLKSAALGCKLVAQGNG